MTEQLTELHHKFYDELSTFGIEIQLFKSQPHHRRPQREYAGYGVRMMPAEINYLSQRSHKNK